MKRWLRVVPLFVVLLTGCMEGNKGNLVTRKAPLYERVGGEKAIRKLVDDFLVEASKDSDLAKAQREHFSRNEDELLKQHLVEKIGQDTGGPQKYTGKKLREVVPKLGLTKYHFEALVKDWKRALINNKIAEAEQNELVELLKSWRNEFVQLES